MAKNVNTLGYLHAGCKIKPLHVMLPKTSASVKDYEMRKLIGYISLIKDDDLLNKYNTI